MDNKVDKLIKKAMALSREDRKWLLEQLLIHEHKRVRTPAEAMQRMLESLANGPRSPRDIEENPPAGMSARDARIATATLLDEGRATLDDRLKVSLITDD